MNDELLKVLDNLRPIFPDEVDRISERGTCEWSMNGLKLQFTEFADNLYTYHINIDVFNNGKLIFPDEVLTFKELTTASEPKKKFIKNLHDAVPSFSMNDIKTMIADFANEIRTDEHYRESARRWDQIAKNRFKDRNNPEAYRQLEDAIRCGGNPFIDSDGKIIKVELATYLIQKYHIKVIVTKDGTKNKLVYFYDGKKGFYLPFGIDKCNTSIYEILGELASTHLNNEIVSRIVNTESIKMMIEEFRPDDPYIINVENGLLDVRTLELKPHSPDYLSTVQYPIKYDPDATCHVFDKFITDGLPDPIDRRDVLEFFGYTLLPYLYNCHQKSLMILGKPGTGKGTLLDVLSNTIGERNVSTVALQDIEDDRFAAFQLVGKIANVSDDLPKKDMKECATYKSASTGKPISVQDKGVSRFDYRVMAKFISAANILPFAPIEDNDAYFRRFIIIRMDQIFKGTKNEDPHLIDKLTSPSEMSGILNVLLQHLSTVIENDRLSYNKSTEDIKRMYELEQNHAAAFFKECTTESVKETLKSDMFEAYLRWCEANGIKEPMDSDGLTRKVNKSTVALKHIKGGQSKKAPYRDQMVWYDIELKIPWMVRTNSPPQVKKPQISLPPIKTIKLEADENGNLRHDIADGQPHEYD